jgi:hypothetical protein
MREHVLWRTESNGFLAAEIGELHLIVQPHAKEFVRFLVLRRTDNRGRPALLCSGHESDVGAAMKAAERKANACLFA